MMPVSVALPRTTALLDEMVDDRMLTRAAQVCVAVDGARVFDYAGGEAAPGIEATGETVFKVYCAIKPITAVAVAQLVDRGILDLDVPAREWLPSCRPLGAHDIAVRHLLNHTAGLHELSGVHVELTREDRRAAMVDRMTIPAAWQVGADVGYSEFAAWHLLGRLIERLAGVPLHDHLRASVLDPLGMSNTFVGMTKREYDEIYPRLGVNFDLRLPRAFPHLYERTEPVCREVNCAYGGYTTARDLVRFYSAVAARPSHACMPRARLLDEFCSSARPWARDVVLERACDYGLGFMTTLDTHHFGSSPSLAAVGHSGWLGTSFAFADPSYRLAVGAVFNGVTDSASAFLRRPNLVDAIYEDLGFVLGDGCPSARRW